jgi:phosphatidylserine decarboxylase
MGEFDVALEDIFTNGTPVQEAKWYPLESRRTGKKKSVVTGEVLLGFQLVDSSNAAASPTQIMQKFMGIAGTSPSPDEEDDDLQRTDSGEQEEQESDKEDASDEPQDESKKAEVAEKRRKRLRLARLKRKAKQRGYEFTGNSEVAGVLFLEITKITDLPPERNSKYSVRLICLGLRPDE